MWLVSVSNAKRTDSSDYHFLHCRMPLTLAPVRTKTSLSSGIQLPSYALISLATASLYFIRTERTVGSRACTPIPTRSEIGCKVVVSLIERVIMSAALNNRGMPSRKCDCVPSFNESRITRSMSGRSFSFLSR